LIHVVDFFEGHSLCLGYTKKGKNDPKETSRAPDKEYLGLKARRTGPAIDQIR